MDCPRRACSVDRWPRWWRVLIVAIGTLILCSCRSGGDVSETMLKAPSPALPQPVPPGSVMSEQSTGARQAVQYGQTTYLAELEPRENEGPEAAAEIPAGMQQAVADQGVVVPTAAQVVSAEADFIPAVPRIPVGPWAPPGFRQPWPPDEYLVDGGDAPPEAAVAGDWTIRGLAPSETIAHYDTVDGRRIVEPANRVYIYSPRFGAVRQVISLRENQQRIAGQGVSQPVAAADQSANRVVLSSKQHYQARGQIGRKSLVVAQSEQHAGGVGNASRLAACQDAFLPYENLSIIRSGKFQEAEMAFLARGTAAAKVWSHTAVVQVFIDHQRAAAEVGSQQVDTLYSVKERPASPKLRIVKVASTAYAAPGETVDFTIRFDNVGDQVIGNVTIVDNLTTRLEYVPDSAQCSLPAEFFTEPSESQSLVLRWEITNPLNPGEGGIIRFRCRVR